MCVHCVVHKNNLAIWSLFNLTFIVRIESFMMNFHGYFNHLPKWSLEFQKLVQIMEINGNNIMKKVKTMWMLMLDPLKKIMEKYCVLLPMIQFDSNSTQVAKVKQNLNGFCEFIWSCLWFSRLETWMQSGIYLWIAWSTVKANFEWFKKKNCEWFMML